MTIQIIPKSFFLMISLTLLFIAGCDDSEDEKKKSQVSLLSNETNIGDGSVAFSLDSRGVSSLIFPFAGNNWVCTSGSKESNCLVKGAHFQNDYYAQDWAKYNSVGTTCGHTIKAPLDGIVIFSGNRENDYGEQVVIRSKKDLSFAIRIAHLEKRFVKQNTEISIGEDIGTVGETGNSPRGCHAHIVLYKNLSEIEIKNELKGIDGTKIGDGEATKFAANFIFKEINSAYTTSTTTTRITTSTSTTRIATSTTTLPPRIEIISGHVLYGYEDGDRNQEKTFKVITSIDFEKNVKFKIMKPNGNGLKASGWADLWLWNASLNDWVHLKEKRYLSGDKPEIIVNDSQFYRGYSYIKVSLDSDNGTRHWIPNDIEIRKI